MTTTVDRPNKDALNKAIDIYRDAMRPFIVRNLRSVPRQRVEDAICRSLNGNQASQFQRNLARNPSNVEAAIDVRDFPILISGNWSGVFSRQFLDSKQGVQGLLSVISEARNKAAHPDTDDLDIEFTTARLYDIMEVMSMINTPAQKREVEEILKSLQEDGVSHFCNEVHRLALNQLPERIKKPDRSSRQVRHINRNPDSFYYELWYSSAPQWGSSRMRYRLELNRRDDSASSWSANVGFRYNKNGLEKLGYSDEHFNILENIVQSSEAHTNLEPFSAGRRPKAMVRFYNKTSLSDDFAQSISCTLATLIQKITPAIDNL